VHARIRVGNARRRAIDMIAPVGNWCDGVTHNSRGADEGSASQARPSGDGSDGGLFRIVNGFANFCCVAAWTHPELVPASCVEPKKINRLSVSFRGAKFRGVDTPKGQP
jgi:hypothetical protein